MTRTLIQIGSAVWVNPADVAAVYVRAGATVPTVLLRDGSTLTAELYGVDGRPKPSTPLDEFTRDLARAVTAAEERPHQPWDRVCSMRFRDTDTQQGHAG